jgi:hypothetical protein
MVSKAPELVEIDQPVPTKGLIAKLSQIMGDLKDIPKSGFNEHQKYAFRKADDVDAAVSKELAKHNVILWPSCVEESSVALYKTASGSTMWLSTVMVEYQFIDGETGEVTPISRIPGTGADTGDKGHAKALTMSKKYFLSEVFLIGGNDDPEADVKVDREAAAAGSTRGSRTVVTKANHGKVERGGKSENGTDAQLTEVKRLARELGVTKQDEMRALIEKVLNGLGTEISFADNESFSDYMKEMSSVAIGGLIVALNALVEASTEEASSAVEEVDDDLDIT